ncbi:hypothetical protein ABZ471_02690 [Streptomyces sp. NPDC005728]|uniref:hypothetical protein n=1 Tax=Streptomyces sp. NPDC005728 TaxID=3157054 RepID=UPI003411A473
MTAAVVVGIAASPASAAAVPPIFVSGNPDAVCPDGSKALRVDPSDTPQVFPIQLPGDGSGTLTVTFTNAQKTVNFTIAQPNSIAVRQVTVKGGDNANRYLDIANTGFPNGIDADTGLISPLNNGGQLPDVSHADFCFIPDNYG